MATEKRLIDANGSYTLNANDNTEHSLCFGGGIINVMDQRGRCICEFDAEDAPIVDAVEVVHGRWETEETTDSLGLPAYRHFHNDDRCKYSYVDNGYGGHYYCPNCGAKMDGGKR